MAAVSKDGELMEMEARRGKKARLGVGGAKLIEKTPAGDKWWHGEERQQGCGGRQKQIK